MDNHTLKTLEFDKILKLIANYAKSEVTKNIIYSIKPLEDYDLITKRHNQINDIQKLIKEGDRLPISNFNDIVPLISKLRPEDSFLEGTELLEFINIFQIISSISDLINRRKDFTHLRDLTKNLTGFPNIQKILVKTIDNEGNIDDNASLQLSQIRTRIRTLEAKIRSKLEEIIHNKNIANFLQDDFITVRSGRWVIPVRMDSKGMVAGIVHDVSKSGETAFIEPLSIINITNELENLKAEQKAEEIRILKNICSILRPLLQNILNEFNILVYIDVLNSIAEFSNKLNMNIPLINNSLEILLVEARHPLLELTLQKFEPPKSIIPLTLRLGIENNVMVITGANAGGKTIAIKTIGLLTIMALSGMPVPASSDSIFPLVKKILVDVGDEQSIEHNLSTFSAHISNVVEILKTIDNNSIVLIDEIGSGTDPEEGSALACAILKELQKSKALIFATTHLSEIKSFVHKNKGMLNASMEFDYKTLTPLYRLRIGEPGQSHALEIAKNYGIPENIIDDAKNLIGKLKVEFDKMVVDYQEKRALYEDLLTKIKNKELEINRKENELIEKIKEINKEYKKIISSAWEEASKIILNIKRQAYIIIDDLKKKGIAEKQITFKKIEDLQTEIEEKISEYNLDKTPKLNIDDLHIGDKIFVKSIKQHATIIEINKKTNRLKVSAKGFDIEVPVKDITFMEEEVLENKNNIEIDLYESTISDGKLNIIGLHSDEAIQKLESFLNHASLSQLNEITIIHGIGKGKLMKAVHEHLKNHPLVKSFKSGDSELGGKAITIVNLI